MHRIHYKETECMGLITQQPNARDSLHSNQMHGINFTTTKCTGLITQQPNARD